MILHIVNLYNHTPTHTHTHLQPGNVSFSTMNLQLVFLVRFIFTLKALEQFLLIVTQRVTFNVAFKVTFVTTFGTLVEFTLITKTRMIK